MRALLTLLAQAWIARSIDDQDLLLRMCLEQQQNAFLFAVNDTIRDLARTILLQHAIAADAPQKYDLDAPLIIVGVCVGVLVLVFLLMIGIPCLRAYVQRKNRLRGYTES